MRNHATGKGCQDMKLIAIAAIGKNWELGLNGDMPWKRALKTDLRFFKKVTMGHPVLMGRKTFETLPGVLPGRTNIVITTHQLEPSDNLITYSSLEAFQKEWQDRDEDVYLMGGASLYRQLLDECQEIILTEIDHSFEADTTFPFFRRRDYDMTILDSVSENGYLYRHHRYVKKEVNQGLYDSCF